LRQPYFDILSTQLFSYPVREAGVNNIVSVDSGSHQNRRRVTEATVVAFNEDGRSSQARTTSEHVGNEFLNRTMKVKV
jgi:hypothetical protein